MSEKDSSPQLAFVVVNYSSSVLLAINLIPAVSECQPDLVVVVDCWSTDRERHSIARLAEAEGWELICLPDNRGFGGGMNAGVTHARSLGATQLLLINPDAKIEVNALRALRTAITDDPFALVAPRIVDGRGRTWFEGAVVHLSDGGTGSRYGVRMKNEVDPDEVWEWISGACMMLSMSLWDAVGGFDESFFLYWEDVDLSRRVITAGGRLVVLREVSVLHDEGGTHEDPAQGKGKSGTYYRYMIRNRLLFASKHLNADGIRRWRRSSIRNAWAVLLQGGRRQFLRPVAPVRAAWRGLLDGRALSAVALKSVEHRRSS